MIGKRDQHFKMELPEQTPAEEPNPLEGVNVEDVKEAQPYDGSDSGKASDILKEKIREWLK